MVGMKLEMSLRQTLKLTPRVRRRLDEGEARANTALPKRPAASKQSGSTRVEE